MPYTLAPDANADLETLRQFAEKSSSEYARTLISGLQKRCETIASMPGMGVPCADLGPDVRKLITPQNIAIIYREKSDNEIDVLRIIDTRRDMDRELQALRLDEKRRVAKTNDQQHEQEQ